MISSTRRAAALSTMLLWAGGLATLAHREHKPPSVGGVLTEAATRFNPGPAYYLVERNGHQIGFASTTSDTTPKGIIFTDFMILQARADSTHRMAVQSAAQVSRSFVLERLDVASDTGAGWTHATADLTADSTLAFKLLFPTTAVRTEQADRAVLAPDVVPMVLGMGTEHPKIGTQVQYRVVDAIAGRVWPVTFRIAAESLFMVADSAAFDSTAHLWRPIHDDTVRAWKVVPSAQLLSGAPSLVAWVDGQGHVVDADADIAGAGAIRFRRMCYELAYRNWPGRRFR
jgi:hypothetical protein